MVHGLWSDLSTFNVMQDNIKKSREYADTPWLFKIVNYENTAAWAFERNVYFVKKNIDSLVFELREMGVSAGNVDYIGHSMGGILGRLYLQGDTYQCGLHKIITINTPHSGSHIANAISDYLPEVCDVIVPLALGKEMIACTAGAVNDLRVDSDVILKVLNGNQRTKRPIPCHSISTTFKKNDIIAPLPDKTFFEKALRRFAFVYIEDYFDSFEGENDLIVTLVSQRGGLTGSCATVITDQPHMGSPSNLKVIEKVRELLLLKPTEKSFCTYFNPEKLNPKLDTAARKKAIASATVSVLTPTTAAKIPSTNKVTVNVVGAEVASITTVIDYSIDSVYVARTIGGDSKISVNFNKDLVGRKGIYSFGMKDKKLVAMDTSHFYVVAPNSNTVPMRPTNLTVSEQQPLLAKLSWSDQSENELGYEIERRSGEGEFKRLAVVDSNVTTYLDSDLAEFVNYKYHVRAFNDKGFSEFSNSVNFISPALILSVETTDHYSLYPNPVSPNQPFFIDLKGTTVTAFEIRDMMGHSLGKWKGKQLDKIQINTPLLSSGIYLIDLTTTTGKQLLYKVLVK